MIMHQVLRIFIAYLKQSAVKLHYNRLLGTSLKGPLYSKSVVSRVGCGRLTGLGNWNIYSPASLATKQFTQPPTLIPAVTVCVQKAGDC